jgi:hypothetical protein
MFGITFWKISRTVPYEKTLEKYLIITGYGFLFLFTANQSTSLVLAPYPPFGLPTVTILIMGAYLVMTGFSTSAKLVSVDVNLRKSIDKIARESILIGHIGTAEMEKEVNNTVEKIIKEVEMKQVLVANKLELDPIELKNYIQEVIKVKNA